MGIPKFGNASSAGKQWQSNTAVAAERERVFTIALHFLFFFIVILETNILHNQ